MVMVMRCGRLGKTISLITPAKIIMNLQRGIRGLLNKAGVSRISGRKTTGKHFITTKNSFKISTWNVLTLKEPSLGNVFKSWE